MASHEKGNKYQPRYEKARGPSQVEAPRPDLRETFADVPCHRPPRPRVSAAFAVLPASWDRDPQPGDTSSSASQHARMPYLLLPLIIWPRRVDGLVWSRRARHVTTDWSSPSTFSHRSGGGGFLGLLACLRLCVKEYYYARFLMVPFFHANYANLTPLLHLSSYIYFFLTL